MTEFGHHLGHYAVEIIPALIIGFLLSGIIHELVPENIIRKYLGQAGLKPILNATFVGALLPVCCFGSLPIAVTFHRKGARLGPVLAFLVVTPATSVSAILVSLKLLKLEFTLFLCLAVIALGILIGIIGNLLRSVMNSGTGDTCPACHSDELLDATKKRTFWNRLLAILRYAFIDLPKHIGLELLIGLVLAALVASVVPVGNLIKANLSGFWGYPFSLIFGLVMYICSTASVPLVHALVTQGMNIGAGMVLLLVGPITSYGTILVLRKHFGTKILLIYLITISGFSLGAGILFYYFHQWMTGLLPNWMVL